MNALLVYDGSFAGWLSAVFEVYERKLKNVDILKAGTIQPDAFANILSIDNIVEKADRVWAGLKKRLSQEGADKIYYCFLSETKGVEALLLRFVRYVFSSAVSIEADFSRPEVLEVSQLARKVWREKHRMEAFVRFAELKDGLYYAAVEPDHNVLPLIAKHFKSRYADQQWLIYDLKRGYGIYYGGKGPVDEVTLRLDEQEVSDTILSANEEFYQLLWQDYFRNTGIAARRNMRLHVQHVPKRYWKHLTEKQG